MENALIEERIPEPEKYATVSIEIAKTEGEVAQKLNREGFRNFQITPCEPNPTFDSKLSAGKKRFSVALSLKELRKL
ncbi:Uncharacterised protein [uncultured archaeon]|nr:Uncharacterised protein [uncultured archaeon]